ncbi:hypothetical protein [Azorhizophilus paspali]|uniref:Uncharacterized protein n=1 Tax=Azorhizophilus paspali TaxID=69963 RepID=A0ABV6SHG1_AZOPA
MLCINGFHISKDTVAAAIASGISAVSFPGGQGAWHWHLNFARPLMVTQSSGLLLPPLPVTVNQLTPSCLHSSVHHLDQPLNLIGRNRPGAVDQRYQSLAHDGAISSLLAIEKAIKAMRLHLADEPWDEHLAWIDAELNRLWEVRGAFPGMGALPGLN